MLHRALLLLLFPLLSYCAVYYPYIPPAYPPPPYYYSRPYNYNPYYYNSVGSGSLWAAGGGLLGNSLAFFLG
ncbi:hypothetical protein Q1695_003019 [Nippostrongylus brasiliensis]|nr:hypothetical protein Q1695_003019 [Nippostrongylus brasiliensis]